MLKPKYKYTRKYVITRVNSNKLLYSFLKENKIYNKFINACLNANTGAYNLDRIDFDKAPFMAFSWADSEILNNYTLSWSQTSLKFDKYKRSIYEEI